jgi:hypothetical protein
VSSAVQAEVKLTVDAMQLASANVAAFGELSKGLAQQLARRPAVEAWLVLQLQANRACYEMVVDIVSVLGHSMKAVTETLREVSDAEGRPAKLVDLK